MALNDNDITEAVEVVEADDSAEEVAVVDGMGETLVLSNGADAMTIDDGDGADDGPNVYTVLMVLSTVAYAAATFVALTALKQYCDPGQWPLW